MKKVICEDFIWNVHPIIRKMIAIRIRSNYGLSQKETAKKMGLTPSAICQYECKKRGKQILNDEILKREIRISAEKIVKEGDIIVGSEICRICGIIKSNGNILDLF